MNKIQTSSWAFILLSVVLSTYPAYDGARAQYAEQPLDQVGAKPVQDFFNGGMTNKHLALAIIIDRSCRWVWLKGVSIDKCGQMKEGNGERLNFCSRYPLTCVGLVFCPKTNKRIDRWGELGRAFHGTTEYILQKGYHTVSCGSFNDTCNGINIGECAFSSGIPKIRVIKDVLATSPPPE